MGRARRSICRRKMGDRPSALEEQLTDTQISNVVTAIRYEGLYEQSLEYKEQSVLMQIDPNQVQRGDIYYVIDSGRWNGADL